MHTSCVVVGAGAAGLATSRALADAGVDHVVLERHEVGDTWRRQRWDSFRLNTPGWMNTMLGPVAPDSFSTRDEVLQLLAERAASLPVQTRSPVVAVDQDGSEFAVRTPTQRISARSVVLASGQLNVPKLPAQRSRLAPRLVHLHTAEYQSPAQLPEGAVLIVGSGQSGCQIAEDLALAGRRVYLATSRVGRYPWRYRGRELIAWQVESGHWDLRPQDLANPAEARAAISVVGSGGHSLNLYILARLGVRLLGRFEDADGERVRIGDSLLDNIAYADEVAATLQAKADAHIAARGIDAPAPDPDAYATVEPPPVVTELDLAAEGIACVIWSTGFTGDLSWVRLPILDANGLPRHDRCVSAVPGLWFVGFPWLTMRRSGILYGIPVDAAEVVEGVVDLLRRSRPLRTSGPADLIQVTRGAGVVRTLRPGRTRLPPPAPTGRHGRT